MVKTRLLFTVAMALSLFRLYGVMHYHTEQGIDFGSPSMENVLALSDGRFASFGAYNVDVCSLDNGTMSFGQRLYSNQYYVDSRACGTDTLYALTWHNRLDKYIYHPSEGLQLVDEYFLESDDSLSLTTRSSLLNDGFCVIGSYVDGGNNETSYCQSLYILNGTEAPVLADRDYINYNNRFVSIIRLGENYYYFDNDRRVYVSASLTNHPEQVSCAGLTGHLVSVSKVLQNSIYTISKDTSSIFWLSKLDTSDPGNINVVWTLNLGNIDSAKITDVMNGNVFLMINANYSTSFVYRYLFSENQEWQFVNTNTYPYDGYQLLPLQNGYLLAGYTRGMLLNDSLGITTSLYAGSNYWWCDQIYLNRFLLMFGENDGYNSIFDLENEVWLNFQTMNVYNKHAMRYGDNQIVFMGGQIQVVTLGDAGIANYQAFQNQSNYMYGSVLNDKLVLCKNMNNIGEIHLYQIAGTTLELLGTLTVGQVTDALQFFDANHFAAICHTVAEGFFLKLYKIEADNSITELASYPATGTAIYVNNNIVIVDGDNGMIVDVSQPDNPVLLNSHPPLNCIGMSFNGFHEYMSIQGDYANIFNDSYQYVDYIENINPFFLSDNRVLFPGPTCAVICTVDEIVANPPDEVLNLPRPENSVSSYPNPFAASTTINYSLVKAGRIELKIFNLKGQLVKKLVEGNCKASAYTANWDGKDEQGRTVASGVYFCILTTNGKSTSQKMLLLK